MNKNIFLLIQMFAIIFYYNTNAQNLAVSIENAADIYGNGVFRPVKSGKSFQFNLKVKNNGNNTEKVRIDTTRGFADTFWITIVNTYKNIKPGKSASFTIKVKVPNNTTDIRSNNRIYLYVVQINQMFQLILVLILTL